LLQHRRNGGCELADRRRVSVEVSVQRVDMVGILKGQAAAAEHLKQDDT
jgi:hypothetical protein